MNLINTLLSDRTKENLQSSGYKKLTDIQGKVIPLILEGKDVIAQSRTGTGKSAPRAQHVLPPVPGASAFHWHLVS